MLLDFGHDVDGFASVTTLVDDANGGVDRRHALVELDVHDGADDLHDSADVLTPHSRHSHRARMRGRAAFQRVPSQALAPETTSMISLVMDACRILFMCSVSESMTSVALSVAASMAVMRAPCSAATDSSSALQICCSM